MPPLTLDLRLRLSSAVRALRVRLLAELTSSAAASARAQRERLERALGGRPLDDALRDVAATWLLRWATLKHLEALGLARTEVVTGAWESRGYRAFREREPEQCRDDAAGFRALLGRACDELAPALPALFGRDELLELLPLPAPALRALADAFDAPALADAFRDETTLGWVYQYWNDPDRDALDARASRRGQIARHEVASKTQMFTERYMVEWLLHNSVGALWLAVCERHGWRAATRMEYLVARTVAPDAVARAPDSLRDVKLLDPACGAGHFLVLALELFLLLYREEARHRGEAWSDAQIVAWILERNLHGVDIDPRAVAVAAAAVHARARALCLDARPGALNLAAPPRADAVARAHPALDELAHLGTLARPSPALEDALARDELPAHARDEARRFLSLLRADHYHVVVANPPYLALSKLEGGDAIEALYPAGRGDLFGAFLLRGRELLREGGLLAAVTLSNWMFLKTFEPLRAALLEDRLELLADLGKGAFCQASMLINTAMVVLRRAPPADHAVALRPNDGAPASTELEQSERTAARLRAQEGRYRFDPESLRAIDGRPLVFWLDPAFLERYRRAEKARDRAALRGGIATTDNARFLRRPWEVPPAALRAALAGDPSRAHVPYIKGADGRAWIDSVSSLLRWRWGALELRAALGHGRGGSFRASEPRELGVAYTTIGNAFAARVHRVPGVLDVSGASLFPAPEHRALLVCALNRTATRRFLEALNPTVNFQLADVARAPLEPLDGADAILATLERAFDEHERARETSVDFVRPGPSAWASAQEWAQRAVDRPAGEPLPEFVAVSAPPRPEAHLSFALGVALGRLHADGGVLDEPPPASLPHGVLYLSAATERDALAHPACAPLREAFERHGAALAGAPDLRAYLRRDFFAHHRDAYEQRPIYLPLSSARKTFVAWVSFHRLGRGTLGALLTEHLVPEKRALEKRLAGLRAKRRGADAAEEAKRRRAEAQRQLDELTAFIAKVRECAERGPPPPDARTPPRERDAPFDLAPDDGVLPHAAALWPLLAPQWREPTGWWRALALGRGREDLDWSRTAARYFPARVRAKCAQDPSLAVAHGCLWELHPDKAAAWEARLLRERGAGHTIDEPAAHAHRTRASSPRAKRARAPRTPRTPRTPLAREE